MKYAKCPPVSEKGEKKKKKNLQYCSMLTSGPALCLTAVSYCSRWPLTMAQVEESKRLLPALAVPGSSRWSCSPTDLRTVRFNSKARIGKYSLGGVLWVSFFFFLFFKLWGGICLFIF